MSNEKLLAGRNAVIYGGGGSVGGAVARAFAHHGATVFLAGRNLAPLERVAESIRQAGGEVATAQLDALEEAAVDDHAADVVAEAGSIDVSLNAIGHPYTHGVPLADLSVKDFMAPIQVAAQSTFITTRAAARQMIPRRSGVILHFGGPGERSGASRDYYLGGTQVAFDAIEAIRRQLAAELGPDGIRVVTLASGGIPDSLPDSVENRSSIAEMIEAQTLIGRAATLDDVGNAAVFAASDWGRTLTGAILNISCGALID
jgi:NAD(P)-dependent dehydrogenase (short-subunit alcohol dehydrogenase family)